MRLFKDYVRVCRLCEFKRLKNDEEEALKISRQVQLCFDYRQIHPADLLSGGVRETGLFRYSRIQTTRAPVIRERIREHLGKKTQISFHNQLT